MKIRIFLISLIVIVSLHGIAQINSTVDDPKSKNEILIGYCNIEGLQKGDYGTHFNNHYNVYEPSKASIKKLERKLDNVEITIVLGTWCSDSKREVPRFYKVLDDAGYNDSLVKVIAVTRDKKAVFFDIDNLDIKRVPTFIIYENGEEIGRIIETPKKSLEKDLEKIVK
jgi:thiol-disulfide isomerase/thioredoxin